MSDLFLGIYLVLMTDLHKDCFWSIDDFIHYCRDLYNWEESRSQALAAYETAKSQWMYVTAYTVGKDLHIIQ